MEMMSKSSNILFIRMIISVTCVALLSVYIGSLLDIDEGISTLIGVVLSFIVGVGYHVCFARKCRKE
ncbi:hypothetical protein AB295_22145 [Salmonella enterica]|uniref:Uncharacterized protein n=1 Tax=Salmonella enterica subsp. enterica serovar Rubislaw str. ATCC 10717 TaxID=938143 RepID=A0A6W0P1Z8_SALRU|nr:hypothetical protein [Salmonella enterica]EBY1810944.1 hypothetical protein [Salmonella enterica subsp. enterica serovar Rubislaw]HAA1128143.1 hypothetical protein [Salmonella enterica subsp. enterica serovar Rubislaw str. ATCC 10717]HCZ4970259.1 hypothetical protein [Salmonella enterica subsp. enterica serovar Saintpaul str. CFSAN004160]EAY7303698.1 hypothetical protein [Salmonella enterica]EAY7317681.1 hypothetical protein [Salmonella enterica]